jgi:ankyrin repeat protein
MMNTTITHQTITTPYSYEGHGPEGYGPCKITLLENNVLGLMLRKISGRDLLQALVCKKFLEGLYESRKTNHINTSPLYAMKCISVNDFAGLEVLLQANLDPDTVVYRTESLLSRASTCIHLTQDTTCISLLIKYGATVDLVVEEKTALLSAVACNCHQAVSCLLSEGADKEGVSNSLFEAVVVGSVKCIDALSKVGVDINQIDPTTGGTALHYIVENCSWSNVDADIDIINALIERGAHINMMDSEGYCPLKLAILRDNIRIIKLLISHGSRLDAYSSEITNLYGLGHSVSNVSALSFAIQHKTPSVAGVLLEAGSDVNCFDPVYGSPLMHAVVENMPAMVSVLTKYSVDLEYIGYCNLNALMYACKYNNKKLVTMLLEAGSDPEAENEHGESISYMAFKSGEFGVMSLIAEAISNIPL